jgi:hypothetical protein
MEHGTSSLTIVVIITLASSSCSSSSSSGEKSSGPLSSLAGSMSSPFSVVFVQELYSSSPVSPTTQRKLELALKISRICLPRHCIRIASPSLILSNENCSQTQSKVSTSSKVMGSNSTW